MQRLVRHGWPGKFRKLGNVVQRLAVLSRDTVVTARDVESVLGDGGEGVSLAEPADLIARAIDDWAREQSLRNEGDGAIPVWPPATVAATPLRPTVDQTSVE